MVDILQSPPLVASPAGTPTTSPAPQSTSFTTGCLPTAPAAGSSAGWQGKVRRWIPDPNDITAVRSRTIVLCFDGTGDQFDNDNSNIVQLLALLKKDDLSQQRVYYQSGVGTYKGPSASTPGTTTKILDLMVANTLGAHVRDGYEFLMENYCAGDKICLFGFSRGAYTARALAGMLQMVGLLPAGNRQQIPFAYQMYSRQDRGTLGLCRDFKRTYGIDVKIEFVGVWDTVASVGVIPRSLPFVSTNNNIRFFRHALALDERRSKFMPNFYKEWAEDDDNGEEDCDDDHDHDGLPADEKAGSWLMRDAPKKKKKPVPPKRERSQAWLLEYDLNARSGQKTDSLEVFFAGSHTDVGGGSVENHVRYSLARIPMRWMIRECFKTRTGIIFDMDMLNKELGMDIDLDNRRMLEAPARISPLVADMRIKTLFKSSSVHGNAPLETPAHTRWKSVLKSKGQLPLSHTPEPSAITGVPSFQGEAYEELQDALSPIYDQLKMVRLWWLLEVLPLRTLKQRAIYNATESSEDFFWLVNKGRGRKIFKHVVRRGIKVHSSVLSRLEALDEQGTPGTYRPKVRPNLHVIRNDEKDVRMHFRRMLHSEWMERRAPGLDDWFEWYDGKQTKSVGTGSDAMARQ